MANKWFYKAQAEASLVIHRDFQNVSLGSQIVQKDLVIEQYQAERSGGAVTIQVQIRKVGSKALLFIYELKQFSAYPVF